MNKIYKQLMGNVTKVYDITYLVNHMKTEVNSIIRDAVSKAVAEAAIKSGVARIESFHIFRRLTKLRLP